MDGSRRGRAWKGHGRSGWRASGSLQLGREVVSTSCVSELFGSGALGIIDWSTSDKKLDKEVDEANDSVSC